MRLQKHIPMDSKSLESQAKVLPKRMLLMLLGLSFVAMASGVFVYSDEEPGLLPTLLASLFLSGSLHVYLEAFHFGPLSRSILRLQEEVDRLTWASREEQAVEGK